MLSGWMLEGVLLSSSKLLERPSNCCSASDTLHFPLYHSAQIGDRLLLCLLQITSGPTKSLPLSMEASVLTVSACLPQEGEAAAAWLYTCRGGSAHRGRRAQRITGKPHCLQLSCNSLFKFMHSMFHTCPDEAFSVAALLFEQGRWEHTDWGTGDLLSLLIAAKDKDGAPAFSPAEVHDEVRKPDKTARCMSI